MATYDITEETLQEQETQAPKAKRTRRSKEEIEAEKKAKAEKAAARAAAKAAKDAEKAAKEASKAQLFRKTPVRKGWSTESSINKMKLHYMHVELELMEGALGTTPGEEDLLKSYIASKAPDKKSLTEEILQHGEEEIEKRQTTIFPKGWFSPEGRKLIDVIFRQESRAETFDKDQLVKLSFLWNYQLRGFFKDSAGFLKRAGYGISNAVTNPQKTVDGTIFVFPRRVAIEPPDLYITDEGELKEFDPLNPKINTRPLRSNYRGKDISSIASSEEIPAGSRLRFTIGYVDEKMREAIIEWLDYGEIHGIGAWRNSGKGIFKWREIQEDYTPYPDDEEEIPEDTTKPGEMADPELLERMVANAETAKSAFIGDDEDA